MARFVSFSTSPYCKLTLTRTLFLDIRIFYRCGIVPPSGFASRTSVIVFVPSQTTSVGCLIIVAVHFWYLYRRVSSENAGMELRQNARAGRIRVVWRASSLGGQSTIRQSIDGMAKSGWKGDGIQKGQAPLFIHSYLFMGAMTIIHGTASNRRCFVLPLKTELRSLQCKAARQED